MLGGHIFIFCIHLALALQESRNFSAEVGHLKPTEEHATEKVEVTIKLSSNVNQSCLLPVDYGDCSTEQDGLVRYFFMLEDGKCEAFVWSGCGGNANKFETMDECSDTCEKHFQKQRQTLITPAMNISQEQPATTHEMDNNIKNVKSFNANFHWGVLRVHPGNNGPGASPDSVYTGRGTVFNTIEGNCLGAIISTTLQTPLQDCAYDCDATDSPVACVGFLYHDGKKSGFSICQLTGRCRRTPAKISGGTFYLRAD